MIAEAAEVRDEGYTVYSHHSEVHLPEKRKESLGDCSRHPIKKARIRGYGRHDPAESVRRADEELENKFARLRDEWKANRGHESSTVRLVMHPAYQKIVGMGPAVVPLLLRELEKQIDSWFWALQVITEANPVPKEDRGDGEAMARAWLAWGKAQGIQW